MEGRGSAHERMVGAVVLKGREDPTISVMAVDWQASKRTSSFIQSTNMQRGKRGKRGHCLIVHQAYRVPLS